METVSSGIIFWSMSAFQRTAIIICVRSAGVLRSFFFGTFSCVVRNISRSTKLAIFQAKGVFCRIIFLYSSLRFRSLPIFLPVGGINLS